ncbi:transcriptional regulator, TetR family [Cyclonatronum proteinivorum]|uniref:Transcriptional regulator, TetR family n=2 Tax=Cyclonatronum proteinivorum TaxID=1457365 RepID=A0A345UL38_9BACT|nr:transcriptional regulator, TetR family [Cyclonatronum proteinivorum]
MEQRVKDRRRAIIGAAEQLFAEKGYEATTMQHVAKKAGTSIGNMYFYFSNKEELMKSMIDELCDEIWQLTPDYSSFDLLPEEDRSTIEALDDYLRVHAFFSKVSFARSLHRIARHALFREHILRFLESKVRERYNEISDFFEGLDRELALAYHLGGVVNMFERILSGELKRTPHEAGLFLAKSKLHIRALPRAEVTRIMDRLQELIPKITASAV